MRMQILRITGEFNFSDNRKGKSTCFLFLKVSNDIHKISRQAHTLAGLNLIFWKSFDLCIGFLYPAIAGSPQTLPVCYWPFLPSFPLCPQNMIQYKYIFLLTWCHQLFNELCFYSIGRYDVADLQCTHYAAFLPHPMETHL